MLISKYYKILNLQPGASDDQITRTYKKLAIKFHPDKNRDRPEWANKAMTDLNVAYTTIMSYRFKNNSTETESQQENTPQENNIKNEQAQFYKKKKDNKDLLIKKFVKYRESAKDSLYKFFQYNLNNLIKRENPINMGIFNRIVLSLRTVYHSINRLLKETDDKELIEHFNIFKELLYNFYRASECLNIIDSYKKQVDVDAYRQYKYGDEALHKAHKEIFYDRHNRGSFKSDIAVSFLIESIRIFKLTIIGYPESTWIVETELKLEYAESLKKYLKLFFTE